MRRRARVPPSLPHARDLPAVPWPAQSENLLIGGTQDNGTEYQQISAGNWRNAEGGDGGYALIDQSATDTTNVTMYHTFYNITGSQIGFDRTFLTSCLSIKDSWPTRGAFGGSNDTTLACDGTASY